MRQYTEKPCPGCGVVAERRAGTLCLECRQLIEIGRERVEEIEAALAIGERIKIGVGERFVFFPPHSAGPSPFLGIKTRDMLEALVSLGQLEEPGKIGRRMLRSVDIHFKTSLYRHHPAITAWAMPGQVEAIKLILDYMRQMFEWYYFTGYDLGKNLLHRLATAGTQELNELVIKRSQ